MVDDDDDDDDDGDVFFVYRVCLFEFFFRFWFSSFPFLAAAL